MWSLKAICGHTHCGPRRCLLSLHCLHICGPCPCPHRRRRGGDGRRASKPWGCLATSVDSSTAQPSFVSDPFKDLPKNFDPRASEQKMYRWWEDNGFFEPDMAAPGKPFVISMPPANVTGRLHMGHAMFVSLQDVMIRFARMRGRCTLWLPGTDHAGIATQMVVEKMLVKEGTCRQELGRGKFLERVWEWKAEYGGAIVNQLRCLGASCDWSREAFTFSDELSEAVNEAFVSLHDEGLIYRGRYMVNWSPSLQTAVSDLEVEYSEEQGTLYYFMYPLANADGHLPVATTRPETILGDTAVAVNPNDLRYQHLIGSECVVPVLGRKIPVVADEYVDMEFGTGALKITPGHDPNDYEIGQRLGLEFINIMNKDGTLNENAGTYSGMERFVARDALWEDMKKQGLVIKEEAYVNRVPRSQRGGEIVEPLVSEQWFVKMEGLAKPALDAVARGDVRLMPDRFEKVFNGWLENIKDWCISRQLWWGHRIPVWYVTSKQCGKTGSSTEAEPTYVVARNEEEATAQAKALYGADVELRQDEDVLDTWFSSGLWPFSTLGWPDESSRDLARFYPTQVMETAYDILFFWVARMIMMGIKFTGKVPFSTVYLHGLVRDESGRKMSKSLGNVVDPLNAVAEMGADPLRYTLVTGTAVGQDLNLSMDRVASARNFCNKLWNIGKFILANLPQQEVGQARRAATCYVMADSFSHLPLAEKWVLSRLHEVVDRVTELLEKYDFGEAGREMYSFVWGDFADWYVEAAKTRLYSDDAGMAEDTRQVLVYSYDAILKLMHPFMPFITEELWQAIPHEGLSLMVAPWPLTRAATDTDALMAFDVLQAVVRSIRNARAEYKVELGRRVPATVVVADDAILRALQSEILALAALAKLDIGMTNVVSPGDGGADEEGMVALVVRDGVEVFLPMSGLFDAAKELERLKKQMGKMEKELQVLTGRLGNENFVKRAPQAVVAEARQQERETQQQQAQVREKIAQMEEFLSKC